MEVRKLYKSGNSIVINMPGKMMRELKILPGSFVQMQLKKGPTIEIKKLEFDKIPSNGGIKEND